MPKSSESRWNSRTKNDLIIEVWEALDCESVGARELEQIQAVLREKFGEGATESPAAIARAVADEGAELRHPEVFECDLKWRKQRMTRSVLKEGLAFSDLASAFESVVKIEEERLQVQTNLHEGKGEKRKGETGTNNIAAELRELREVVIAARGESLLRARSKILSEGQRRQAKEISEWLTVWLQAPELFSDWLDLRRRSPEFHRNFPDG
jgi:hypothetical protein